MKKLKSILTAAFFIAAALIFLSKPEIYAASALSGLTLFATGILPSLLPFLVISRLITDTGALDFVSPVLRRPLKSLYGLPEKSGSVLMLSLLCGYPAGARLSSDFSESQGLTFRETRTLAAIASVAGPSFLFGVIYGLIKDLRAVFIIAACHYLSALITGFVLRNGKPDKYASKGAALNAGPKPSARQNDALTEAIEAAAKTAVTVCGFITLFNLLSDMLKNTGILAPAAALLTRLISNERAAYGILTGLIETSRGLSELMKSGAAPSLSIPVSAAIVSFGGLSVVMQSAAFLKRAGVSFFSCLLFKLLQGLFAGLLAAVAVLI